MPGYYTSDSCSMVLNSYQTDISDDIITFWAMYVNEKNLGGIMFWSIDNDDFRGTCHGRPYPIIEAAKEALFGINSE
ncbi:hypothetical protein WDU94_003666 [Cyamophila willieti]